MWCVTRVTCLVLGKNPCEITSLTNSFVFAWRFTFNRSILKSPISKIFYFIPLLYSVFQLFVAYMYTNVSTRLRIGAVYDPYYYCLAFINLDFKKYRFYNMRN